MMRGAGRAHHILVASLILLLRCTPIQRPSAGSRILAEEISFGIQRMQVVYGLDFQALCNVTAYYQGVSLSSWETDESFLGVGPKPCYMTIWLLGTEIPMQVLDQPPLGRFSAIHASGDCSGIWCGTKASVSTWARAASV